MTIGQRIAEERKRLGISQEALGEKLGISRQAISKWESDASVPEIDKLIALSKLFSVSVGWLLGVEAESAEVQELAGNASSDQPSLRQAILAYLKTLPGLRKLGIALLILVQLFLYWQLLWCYNAANEARMYAGLAEHATDQLELDIKALREEFLHRQEAEPGTLLAVYNFDTVQPEGIAKATISFSAVPYLWQEGDTATLYIQGQGIPTMQIPCQWDGSFLNCFAALNLQNGIELCFSLEHADGSRQFQPLYDEYLQSTNFAEAPLIIGSVKAAEYDPEDNTFLVQQLEVNFSRSEAHMQSGVTWQTWAVLLLADGEEIGRCTIFDAAVQADSTRTGGGGGIGASRKEIPLISGVTLEEGQQIELAAFADFSNGISSLESLQRWRVGADGSLEPIPET